MLNAINLTLNMSSTGKNSKLKPKAGYVFKQMSSTCRREHKCVAESEEAVTTYIITEGTVLKEQLAE